MTLQKMKHCIRLAILLLVITSTHVFAQIVVTGNVVDQAQRAIAGATVSTRSGNESIGAITGQDGGFQLELLGCIRSCWYVIGA